MGDSPQTGMTARFTAPTLRFAGIMLAALLSACAPYVQLGGPPQTTPMLAADTVVMDDGYALPLRRWLPNEGQRAAPRAVLLAVHGFNDYSNAFVLAGPALADRGVAVFAIDQRGFGATPTRGFWPAEDRAVSDIHQTVRLLRSVYSGVPVYVLGDSMGAAMVIAAFTADAAPPVDGVILNAPAVWGRDTFNVFYRMLLWTFAHTVPGYTVTGKGVQVTISDNRDILRQMSRDPLMIRETRFDALYGLVHLMDRALDRAPQLDGRVLVLYGLKDEVIPRPSMCRFVERVNPRATVRFYPQGYHLLLRDLQAANVIADIDEWMAGQGIGSTLETISRACPSRGAAAGG